MNAAGGNTIAIFSYCAALGLALGISMIQVGHPLYRVIMIGSRRSALANALAAYAVCGFILTVYAGWEASPAVVASIIASFVAALVIFAVGAFTAKPAPPGAGWQ